MALTSDFNRSKALFYKGFTIIQPDIITVIIFLKKRGEKSKFCLSLLQSSD